MALTRLFAVGLGCGLLASTGCTVYAPMQPLMPLVRQRGQLEAGASTQFTGRVEATGAYSPVRRVVLTAGGTLAPKLGDRYFLVTRQYEVGAGLYQPLGPRWLLSGLAGYGQAYCRRGYVDLGIFGPGVYSEYEAAYAKRFGQLGIAYGEDSRAISLTYRLVRINFDYLRDADYGPLPLPAMTRHELALSNRLGFGARPTPRWLLTSAVGLSLSGTARLDDTGTSSPYHVVYEANRNLLPAFFMSLGVVFRPARTRQ
ncbi:hypothetical protein [Hymenobacter psoromatis]|uniref:hypothetical protein n=1 Tax=Hymenobacter psoromatis TaxID=1484116 RepID=UPI001CC0E9DF|nr:hypothetical protein [Hymenobacter psoromatis]